MKYTTLLFDADDTLFDFDIAEDISLRSFYKIQKIPCSYERFYEEYRRENALLWSALEEGEIQASQIKTKRFENTMKALSLYKDNAEELSTLFIDELAKCDHLLDGALELIAAIAPHYKMYIITNGLWDVQRRRIGNSPLYKFFDGMVVSEKVRSAKPDRGIFEEALKTAGNPPKSEILMIGDNLKADILGANLFGIDSCWYNPLKEFNPGEIIPRWEIHSFKELEEFLQY